jgi:hypothetical protein
MDPFSPNPLGDGAAELFRQSPPAALDPYRSFFLAKITGRTLVAGVWLYNWTEQSFDRATAAPADANPRRAGAYVAGVPVHPAVEVNNAQVDVGAFVFMRAKGIVKGQTYYEFFAATVSTAGSGGSGPFCTGCGWIAGLTAKDCLSVSILAALGRCGCAAPPRTTACTICPNGAPSVWTFTLAGGTGDFASANGAWTISRTTGCQWTATRNGWTATLALTGTFGTATGQLALFGPGGAELSWTVSIGASCCGPVVMGSLASVGTGTPPGDPTLTSAGECEPVQLTSTDGGATFTTGDKTVTICGVAYTLAMTATGCDAPCLTLTVPGSGGTTYTAVLDCCGCNFALFSIGNPAVCTGTTDEDAGPCGNVLRLLVRWPCDPLLTPDTCDFCPGDAIAVRFRFEVTGITYSGSGCALIGPCNQLNSSGTLNGGVNGHFYVAWTGCAWDGPENPGFGLYNLAACNGSGTAINLAHAVVAGVDIMRLTIFNSLDTFATYETPLGTWDCQSPLTLSLVSSGTRCVGWPATITVHPA